MDPLLLVLGAGGLLVGWVTFVFVRMRWTQDKAWFRRAPELVPVASGLGFTSQEYAEGAAPKLLHSTLFAQKWSSVPTYGMEGKRGDLEVAVLDVGYRLAGLPHAWRTAVVFRAPEVRWPRCFIVPLRTGGDPSEIEGCKDFTLQEVGGEFEDEYSFHGRDAADVRRLTPDVKRRLMDAANKGEPLLIECLGDRMLVNVTVESPPGQRLAEFVTEAEVWQRMLAQTRSAPVASVPVATAPAAAAAPLAAKFCPQCGTPLSGPARFCPQCGKPIS